jgi:hypothetical protein
MKPDAIYYFRFIFEFQIRLSKKLVVVNLLLIELFIINSRGSRK